MIDRELAVEASLAQEVDKHDSCASGNKLAEPAPAEVSLEMSGFQELQNQHTGVVSWVR